MNIVLICGGSRPEEALLLSAGEERMRVMLRGRADTMEFRRIEGVWRSESGAAVEIGAMIPAESRGRRDEARAMAALGTGFAVDRSGRLLAN